MGLRWRLAVRPCPAVGTGSRMGIEAPIDDNPAMKRTVLIVDDHAGFRASARRVLESEGYSVIAEAADGSAGVTAAAEANPDVALVDVQLPDFDGFEVTKRMRDAGATRPDRPHFEPRARRLRVADRHQRRRGLRLEGRAVGGYAGGAAAVSGCGGRCSRWGRWADRGDRRRPGHAGRAATWSTAARDRPRPRHRLGVIGAAPGRLMAQAGERLQPLMTADRLPLLGMARLPTKNLHRLRWRRPPAVRRRRRRLRRRRRPAPLAFRARLRSRHLCLLQRSVTSVPPLRRRLMRRMPQQHRRPGRQRRPRERHRPRDQPSGLVFRHRLVCSAATGARRTRRNDARCARSSSREPSSSSSSASA